jgi:hypothetical protein
VPDLKKLGLPTKTPFVLHRLRKEKVPLCLIYGREDPWVVPFWGQQVKQHVPDAVYYELSPVGHCPHHEAPEVIILASSLLAIILLFSIVLVRYFGDLSCWFKFFDLSAQEGEGMFRVHSGVAKLILL